MKLKIDTSDNKKLKLELSALQKEIVINRGAFSSDVTLLEIEKILGENGIGLRDIKSIEVVRGPGSFTGLKIGCSIANALSFALLISVNEKPLGEIEIPVYS